MKNCIVILLLLLICINSKAQETDTNKMAYTLNLDGRSSAVNVKLIYPPSNKASTVFNFGIRDFGGQTDIFRVMEELKPGGSDKLKINVSAGKITVYHSEESLHELTYRINGSVERDSTAAAVYRQLFRPVITEGHLYLTGPFFELLPEGGQADKISIKFTGLPPNIPTFLSWAPETDPLKESIVPMAESMQILISMGMDQHIEKYDVHKIPYYFLHSGRDTVNNLDSLIKPFFSHYFPSLRDFWKDDHANYYYLYLSPLYYTRMMSGGGFNWGPGFVMKYNRKIDNQLISTIAHETSHSWIGNSKLKLGSNSLDHQWFGEGFNDYVCLINLSKCGMFSDDVFIDRLNKIFAEHYTNKINTAPNDSISSKYWTDRNYQKLPYTRGTIFAFYLDNQIRLASKGKYTLRDMLLTLWEKARGVEKLEINDFIDVAANYLPEENIRKEVNNYMIRGELIDFRSATIMPDFKISFATGFPVLSLNGGNLKNFYKW